MTNSNLLNIQEDNINIIDNIIDKIQNPREINSNENLLENFINQIHKPEKIEENKKDELINQFNDENFNINSLNQIPHSDFNHNTEIKELSYTCFKDQNIDNSSIFYNTFL